MDLVLEEKPPRERWPLVFRMAIAVAAGAAAARRPALRRLSLTWATALATS